MTSRFSWPKWNGLWVITETQRAGAFYDQTKKYHEPETMKMDARYRKLHVDICDSDRVQLVQVGPSPEATKEEEGPVNPKSINQKKRCADSC